MSFLRKYSFLILIAALSFFAIMPLMQAGFFPMHDDEQVGRLYELDQSLKAGHFPVRIAQDLGFGYGYPLFNFYPSFIYYVAEVFVLVGIGYITSIEMMIGLGFILSAVFMYLFSKEYLGKYGGLVSAIAYIYVPYHALDVYVRGALPEFWSFVFIPAIFWSYKKLADTRQNRFAIISALFIGGLIFTHNLVAMMGGLFFAIYLFYLLYETKTKRTFIWQVMTSGILGLTVSASFWIPSFFERDTTMIKLLTMETADYTQHFVYLRQLWDSAWGYGGSLYGLEDGISFEIGKAHIIGSIIAFFIGVWFFIKKNKVWKILFLFLVLLGIAVFMMTQHSHLIWDNLQLFAYIQFPWRFLLFSAFASSFLLGSVLLLFKSQKIQIVITAILIGIIIFSYKDYFVPKEYLTSVTDDDYINTDIIKWKTSIMAFEYVPDGITTRKVNGSTKVDINKNQVASTSATVIKGNIVIQDEVIKPHYKKLSVKSSGGVLRINQFYYPGWKIFIDGTEVSYSQNNKLKLMDIIVPSGDHTIEVKFTDTPARIIGNVLTAASILVILLYIILILRKGTVKKAYEKGSKSKHK